MGKTALTKKIFYLAFFLLFIPLDLGMTLFALQRLTIVKGLPELMQVQVKELSHKKYPAQVYAALPGTVGEIISSVQTNDARPVIIEKYLKKYNSAMTPHEKIAQKVVEVSDHFGLDWRLLIAIAQQESNLGKKMPENCFNAWGYGIHSQGTLCFNSWEEGIETVAKGIKEKYVDQGLSTPEAIMAKYTPQSSGSWAFGVNQFLEDLQSGEVN